MSKRVIWKFPFEVADFVKIEMPLGACILHVGTQPSMSSEGGEQACLWAIVDPDARVEDFSFRIFGTGQPMPDVAQPPYPLPQNMVIIGTFQMNRGGETWHMFQVVW